jgi:hypothetical protein
MMKSRTANFRTLIVVFALLGLASLSAAQTANGPVKTRLAVVGLDHDHVWSLRKDIAGEPAAELVAIAESDAALVTRAQTKCPPPSNFMPTTWRCWTRRSRKR